MEISRIVFTCAICVAIVYSRPTRWCVTNRAEEVKCAAFKLILTNLTVQRVPGYEDIPSEFRCVSRTDVFQCMAALEADDADLVTLDSGLAYFAGRQHNLLPLMAEDYGYQAAGIQPSYYAVALVRTNGGVQLENLGSKRVCFPGIGTSAGWLYPISKLIAQRYITISECNAIVKAVTTFFREICLPGALTSFYNPYGNNPTSVCRLCTGQNREFCTMSDTRAGFDGAFRCLADGPDNGGDIAFLRHDTLESMTNSSLHPGATYNADMFRLLCPDGSTQTVDAYRGCHWGSVPSNLVMTSATRGSLVAAGYRKLLTQAVAWFGPAGTHHHHFQLFRSNRSYSTDEYHYVLSRRNQMFSDETRRLLDVSDQTYTQWVGDDFDNTLDSMNHCPSDTIRWCVISEPEKRKCERMMQAFRAKDLKPDMDCLYGGNTTACMRMIQQGDADLIGLDPGDVYVAGRRFGLVSIAAEDYGDMSMQTKVVAVARKTDKSTTLFNMKGRRACQAGIGRGDGWVVPVNIYIETEQFLPRDCSIFDNIGQLFVRSCIPGALDEEYNPSQKPINLCEGCSSGGYRKCQRNSEEQYYGDSGAFRCLVEKGGDVAFVRHLTVRDNTDGRNHAFWARNRRSDDYELMCKDGRRLNIDRFTDCHLGHIPANAVVTSGNKMKAQKDIIWNLLNYGQQFFSSDSDGDFHMFDSGNLYSDLLFTDAAVRLMKIPESLQTYEAWLGEDFIAQITNLHKYTCVSPDGAGLLTVSLLVLVPASLLTTCLWMSRSPVNI